MKESIGKVDDHFDGSFDIYFDGVYNFVVKEKEKRKLQYIHLPPLLQKEYIDKKEKKRVN